MQFNCTFTTYRRETSGTNRQYSATATITNGDGYIESASGELRAVLGLAAAVKAYTLLTEESNFQIADRLVINAVNYHVEALEDAEISGAQFSRLLIVKQGT